MINLSFDSSASMYKIVIYVHFTIKLRSLKRVVGSLVLLEESKISGYRSVGVMDWPRREGVDPSLAVL